MGTIDVDVKVAAAAYYKAKGMSNAEISALLRVDLSTVSRYLKQAEQARWLVHKLDLSLPKDLEREVRMSLRAIELEDRLFEFLAKIQSSNQNYIRRQGIVVVQGSSEPAAEGVVSTVLHTEGARLLVDVLEQQTRSRRIVLGVTWGRRTGGVVSSLEAMDVPALPELQIVAMQGGVGREMAQGRGGQYYPDVLAERISLLFGSNQAPARISLPAFIPAKLLGKLRDGGLESIWEFIESDQSFVAATALYQQLDVALVGVGGFERGAWAVTSGYLETSNVTVLRRAGAVGDIACRFYRETDEPPIEGSDIPAHGADVIRAANLRAIGIRLRTLAARVSAGARVIGVAGGGLGAKAVALRAAVRAGLVSDIVTDEPTCLAMMRPAPRKSH